MINEIWRFNVSWRKFLGFYGFSVYDLGSGPGLGICGYDLPISGKKELK